MTTNGEWLEQLANNAPDELAAWFDAEHAEHQERALDGDTAAPEAKIAYPMHHGYKGVKADMVIFDELHDEHDSREKLEADAFAYLQTAYITYPQIIKLLDRQAAITAEETSDAWEEYRDVTQREITELQARVDELTAERDKLQEQLHIGWECECRLQAERDELKGQVFTLKCECDDLENERDNLAADLAECEAERERYREKFGKCLDYADAIHALMDDEGMA